ncbi:hypothetical protein LWI29_020705 [Acer saccharum]|uniref:CCHC-type domain-containing protein n=1 Tax=Acer saccharum TaxID=4024 RepID=A0AA39W5Y0_ACESA|nr:hypothetical protein LWI29_020705 [Acer saccharum]
MVYPELKTKCRLRSSGDNFHTWKHKLDFVLFDNKLNYVLTEPVPDHENDSVAYKKFNDDDFTARHLILGCVDDNLYKAYYRHDSARSLLDALTSAFGKPSFAKRVCLYRRYTRHKMPEDADVSEQIVMLRAMAVELELEGLNVDEVMQKVALLNSLPEWWEEQYHDAIVAMHSDVLSLEDLEQRVRDIWAFAKSYNERDQSQNEEEPEVRSVSGLSFRSSSEGFFRGNCYGCGEFGHRQADCPNEDDDAAL